MPSQKTQSRSSLLFSMPNFECCENMLRGSPESTDATVQTVKGNNKPCITAVLQYASCTSLILYFMYLDMVVDGQVKTEQGKRSTKM